MTLLGRLFGPSLGVRLRPDTGDPSGADTAPGELVEFRMVAAPLFLGAGALGLTSTICTVAIADPTAGFRPVPVALIAIGGLLVGALLAVTRFSIRPWMIHLCGAFACAASTLASYWSGASFAPYGAMFLILTAIALVMFLDHRGSFVLLALIGACEAWLQVALRPNPSPVARWLLLVGVCAVGAATVEALVGRLAATSRAEATARLAAEAARAQAESSRQQMEAAGRHKSEFLAHMSHELRTPLNAVIGFAEVLGGQHFGELNQRQAEYVQDINAAGAHLLALINDVLDLAKVESGRMDIQPHWFSLTESISASVNLVRTRASTSQVMLRVDVAQEVQDAYGDQRRIQQVLVNLLANAVRFTPPGGLVEVVARASHQAVIVEVHDTGIGIAAEDLHRIFEDFQQVNGPDQANEGTGLGLALARRFLDLHGGDIWVRSEPGIGSTFAFRLPSPAVATAPRGVLSPSVR